LFNRPSTGVRVSGFTSRFGFQPPHRRRGIFFSTMKHTIFSILIFAHCFNADAQQPSADNSAQAFYTNSPAFHNVALPHSFNIAYNQDWNALVKRHQEDARKRHSPQPAIQDVIDCIHFPPDSHIYIALKSLVELSYLIAINDGCNEQEAVFEAADYLAKKLDEMLAQIKKE